MYLCPHMHTYAHVWLPTYMYTYTHTHTHIYIYYTHNIHVLILQQASQLPTGFVVVLPCSFQIKVPVCKDGMM